MSQLLADMETAIADAPTFIARVGALPVNKKDRVYFLRNESDFPKSVLPFCIVDFPNPTWTQNFGDRCFQKDNVVVVDFYDTYVTASGIKADSLRFIDYLDNLLQEITDTITFRVASVVQILRPHVPHIDKRATDTENDIWSASYAFTFSIG